MIGIDAACGLALIGLLAAHVFPTADEGTGEPTLAHELFAGDSAALLVMLAGLGLALQTGGRTPHQGRRLTADRAGIAVRAVLVALTGLLIAALMPADPPANGILLYFAVFFLLTLPFLLLRPRALFLSAAACGIITPVLIQQRPYPVLPETSVYEHIVVTLVTEPVEGVHCDGSCARTARASGGIVQWNAQAVLSDGSATMLPGALDVRWAGDPEARPAIWAGDPSVKRTRAVITSLLPLLLLTSCSAPDPPDCVLDLDQMPESWRPSGTVQQALVAESWSESESEEAAFSVRKGIEEMVELYEQRPKAVGDLWEDSVASLIEVTYASANSAEVDELARDGARQNVTALIQPFLASDPASIQCADYESVLPLAIHAHNLYQSHDTRVGHMVGLANAALAECGSLSTAMEIDYAPMLAAGEASLEEAFDLMLWSLLLIEAQTVPGLDVSAEARNLPVKAWRFFRAYPLPGAGEFPAGAADEEFIETAYLATHIVYIPTGNHRFPIYVEDAPNVYDFHRENFYPVLQMGELDLVAEFVDSLRQYGCTAENDLQVRDGTRYLLNIFHAGGDRWMAYREPGQSDRDVDDYDLIHKAWTAVLGVREREIEKPEHGTYGRVVRGWLPAPR